MTSRAPPSWSKSGHRPEHDPTPDRLAGAGRTHCSPVHRTPPGGPPRTRYRVRLVVVSQDELSEIRRRLRAVEQDAAAARVLAGAADRDVSEIRAEIRDLRQATAGSFNALREDFVDLREDFVDLREDFSSLREEVGRGFVEMRGKLDATAAGQQRIVELIESLIDQQDR